MQIDDIKKKNIINHESDYIANHYGFDFVDVEEKIFKDNNLVEDEKLKILKSFKSELGAKRISPLKMFFYKKPVVKKTSGMGMDIINVESALAEATVIKTAISILENEGYSDFTVILNAIGDRESQKAFKSALSAFYKENRSELKAIEQKKITKDPLSIYYTFNKKYLQEINARAPSPMQFLSKRSIEHFQDTIEFLESFGIDYLIDENMTGSKLFFSKIIFKIMAKAPGKKEVEEVAFGGRYDEIGGDVLKKKKVSAIGLSMNFQKKKNKKVKLLKKKINIHLLKIGSTSKLKYLEIIDAMAKVGVPVSYDIDKEKISEQIKRAAAKESEYVLIIGEQEAKKDKVLIRRMSDFSQTEIPIKDVGKYVKKLIK